MKKRIILTIVICAALISQVGIQSSTQNTDSRISIKSPLDLSDDLILAPSYIIDRIIEEKESILKTNEAVDKYLVTDLFFEDKNNVSTVIFDVDGNIIGAIKGYVGTSRMIDSRTLLFDNKSHITFWNLETNEMEHLENLYRYHHDYEYNPLTDTFFGLGREKVGSRHWRRDISCRI